MSLTLVAALVIGCGSDSTSPPSINGEYALQTVRGEGLPVLLRDLPPDYSLQITGGMIAINGDLTFSDSCTFREYRSGVFTTKTIACTGRWTPAGQYITPVETATPGCGDRGTGEWNGRNKLTVARNAIGTAEHVRCGTPIGVGTPARC